MKQIRAFLKFIFIALVKGYQYFISPMMGSNCRFYPTCSSYMIEAIEVHGPLKGLYLGTKRILRCHPYSEGGVDPVPPCKCSHSQEHAEKLPNSDRL